MSGGSMDYAFRKVEEATDGLRLSTPLRRAFAKHLALVAKALHDIEWVDSGDYGPAIRDCLGPRDVLEEVVRAAVVARDELDAEIKRVKAELPPLPLPRA